MLDLYLRPAKEQILVPLCHRLPQWVTPTGLTMLALSCGLTTCYTAAFSSHTSAALLMWLANRLLDGLDGSLARARNIASETRGFIDLLSDFCIYSLLPISIAYSNGCRHIQLASDWPSVAFLEATFHINNFVLLYVAIAEEKMHSTSGALTSLVMKPVLVEGVESSIWFALMLLFPGSLSMMSWALGIAVLVGIVQRVVYVLPILRQLDKMKKKG